MYFLPQRHLSFNYEKVKVCYGTLVIIGDQKSMMNLTQFETKSGAKNAKLEESRKKNAV